MGTPIARTQLVTTSPTATGEGGIAAIPIAQKGAAGGVATLDETGKLPAGQMRMAEETAARFDAVEAAVASIELTPGPKGDKGDTGAASTVQGPKGDTGADGAASTVPGPKGDTGLQGVKGDTGNQGVKGDTGLTGAASTVAGPQGNPGIQGIQGLTGPSGNTGYTTGAGGAVTQATSRVTGVTLNKLTGAITLFSKTTTASLVESFTVTNSTIALTDTINLSVRGTGIYIVGVTQVAAGSFRVSVFTPAAVATAEAPVINFAVIKAVAA